MNPLRSFLLAAGNLVAFLIVLILAPFAFFLLLISGLVASLHKRTAPVPLQPRSDDARQQASRSYRPPASIVVPNWNGKDLLEKYLPSVIAACDFAYGDQLIVVDNASSDGSADFVEQYFPQVTLLRLRENLGFGGGCNAGVHAARCEHLVLLNSDMRVEPDFLPPLLQPFQDPLVFAVAAQIRFSDPAKRREESGLTYALFRNGEFVLGHDLDCDTPREMPCFYPGGGSSAFRRDKLLVIGGFDHLFRPFYLEDTDLGMEAWKRGWKVLYQPGSIVYHEHRGTIGKRFSRSFVDAIIQKNKILFAWKHLDHPGQLAIAFFRLLLDSLLSVFQPHANQRPSALAALRAFAQLPGATRARYRTVYLSQLSTSEALRRHQPDYFRDRFPSSSIPGQRLRVLFLSPYPIYPPHHGGAILMSQALEHLCTLCDVHLIVLMEHESERHAHQMHAHRVASIHLLVRGQPARRTRFGTSPKAVREFSLPELRRTIDRIIYENQIDVLQIEYTNMAQYARRYRSILTALFEHDIYFQTVARRITHRRVSIGVSTILEYLRALQFELRALRQVDYVQVCTPDNAEYLFSYMPKLRNRTDAILRAGIDIARYPFSQQTRLPRTLLFIGNFRHRPNQEGLEWLLREVMPRLEERCRGITLRVIGANATLLRLPCPAPSWLELLGEVPSIQPHLQECTLFVCPVLTGSGVRVKLLEAFAVGIPVVSTSVGAEGLYGTNADVCRVEDSPAAFADAILELLNHPQVAQALATRARLMVEQNWDARRNTELLVKRYQSLLQQKRAGAATAIQVRGQDRSVPVTER